MGAEGYDCPALVTGNVSAYQAVIVAQKVQRKPSGRVTHAHGGIREDRANNAD